MSDYLDRLAERSLQPAREVQPQLLSIFEEPAVGDAEAAGTGATFASEIREEREASPKPQSSSPGGEAKARLGKMQLLWSPQPPADAAPSMNSRSRENAGFEARANLTSEAPSSRTAAALHLSKYPVPAADRPIPTALPTASVPFISPQPSVQPGPPRDAITPTAVASPTRAPQSSDVDLTESRPKSTGNKRNPAPPFRAPPAIRSQRAVPSAEPRVTGATRNNAAEIEPRKEPEPRVIQITIGRLEIRAATSVPRSAAASRPAAPTPMALDEYLRRTAAGGRP